ncbi:colorectal cancer associated 2 [Echeneis naucrates]|uniref:colorectal cancer associated 2 n=1 Tax=Echeneis naucrates TaxID=173247 RepID=UPI001113EB31|nr:epidermal growth factor receptor substrate 15 homolog [Echeneis naucrates]
MSGKKVYQGVRVKITVKEMLQRRRAQEANSGQQKTMSQACSELQDLRASTLPNFIPSVRHVQPPPAISPVGALQMLTGAACQVPDGACSFPAHWDAFNDNLQQFVDVVLPGNCYSGTTTTDNNNNNNNNNNSFSCSLPPPPALPLSWCHAVSSDADYYGAVAPCSSPESLKLDPNSYSPQDSFSSSSSSSCYNSPTRMESGFPGFVPEHHPYCSLQDCYCWPGQPESLPAPEYTPYYGATDFPYGCPEEESYFKSSEMCYNTL